MNKEIKQVKTVDCLRGLAALAVCYFHFTWGKKEFLEDDNILKIIGGYGFLGVQIFFIISGFILPLSMKANRYKLKNFFTFILKRLVRLDPSYIIVIVLTIILNYISTLSPYYRGNPFHIDFSALILHLGYLTTIFNKDWINPVFWTLALEFQFYLILALIYQYINSKKAIFYLFIIASLVLSLISESDSYILKYLPFFILGIVFFYYYISKIKIMEFSLITVGLYLFIYLRFDIHHLIASTIPLIIFYDSQINNKFFLFLGKISYSLYLLHVPIGMRIINITQAKISSVWLKELLLLVNLTFIILISYGFYKLIERHAINLSKKIKYSYNGS